MARLGDHLDVELLAALGCQCVDEAVDGRQVGHLGGFGCRAELAIEIEKIDSLGQCATTLACDVFFDLVFDRIQNPFRILAVNMELEGFFHQPFYEGGQCRWRLRRAGVYSRRSIENRWKRMARANDWASKVMTLVHGGNRAGAIAQIKVAPSVKDLKALQTVMTLSRLTGKWPEFDAAIADNLALLSAPRLSRSPGR